MEENGDEPGRRIVKEELKSDGSALPWADEAAFAHRNWTGRGIYQASFVPAQEGGWRIGSVATGAELSRMRSPEHDCVMLELVLVAIVLGEPAVELWARLRALA